MRIVGSFVLVLVLASAAQAARVVGTASNDVLVGTSRADTILGREGRDRLSGRGGTDFLSAGPARDVVDAGPGADRVSVEYDGARDVVRCGPGADVVNADLEDAVAADCELVSMRLSRDPYTGAEAQHESEVEPDSLTVGRTTVVAFQVGRRFNGAADNIGFAVSTDDGRSWRSGLLPGLTRVSSPPGPHERASDPVVAYDAVAGVWLIGTLALEGRATRLTVSRSSDGVSWSTPVVAADSAASGSVAFDKNWIVCDNGASSAFRGRCYIPYTDVIEDDELAVLSSSDGGLTWSARVRARATGVSGAFPVVRPNGDLVVAYLWRGRRIGASVSTDGGATFQPPVTVAEFDARDARGLRFPPLPSADVEPSGRVWVTWSDCRFSRTCGANSVVVSTSADGRVWTAPTRATTGRDAYLPAVGIHPTSGAVAIVYYVRRANGGVDAELVESRGGRFGTPRRLSAQTMKPEWMPDTRSGRMLADYLSVHYAGSRPLAVWVLASPPSGGELRQAVYATRG